MTPRKLRLLADCIEQGNIPQDDHKGWATDLRGHAKSVERAVMLDGEQPSTVCPACNGILVSGWRCWTCGRTGPIGATCTAPEAQR